MAVAQIQWVRAPRQFARLRFRLTKTARSTSTRRTNINQQFIEEYRDLYDPQTCSAAFLQGKDVSEEQYRRQVQSGCRCAARSPRRPRRGWY